METLRIVLLHFGIAASMAAAFAIASLVRKVWRALADRRLAHRGKRIRRASVYWDALARTTARNVSALSQSPSRRSEERHRHPALGNQRP